MRTGLDGVVPSVRLVATVLQGCEGRSRSLQQSNRSWTQGGEVVDGLDGLTRLRCGCDVLAIYCDVLATCFR